VFILNAPKVTPLTDCGIIEPPRVLVSNIPLTKYVIVASFIVKQ
jgi:hypothetical protein